MSGIEDVHKQVWETVRTIQPLLHGKGTFVQGAALADLTSIWLAGMFVFGDSNEVDRVATDKLRKDMMEQHVASIFGLIPVNEDEILARLKAGSS
jgi:hypothetical protein